MPRTVRLFLAAAVCLPLAVAEGADKETQKLEKQLRDKDVEVRARAAWELGQVGAVESVPALSVALNDSSAAVRANAAASLWKLGNASKPALPALMKALDDSSGAVVGNAAGALTKLGVPKVELLSAYKRLLNRRDCESRLVGVKGLVNEVPPLDIFDHAWDCVDAPNLESDTKSEARSALRKIVGRRDRVLVPRILEILRTTSTRDVGDLITPVSRLEPPVTEAVPLLAALVDSRNDSNAKSALYGLGEMKTAALPALPRLLDCLQSKRDAEIRASAAESIGKIGPKAISAVTVLAKVGAEDKWPKVRAACMTALGEMGPAAAKEGSPVLRAALKDPDAHLALAARNALFRVEPNKREEVADILDKARPVQKGSLFDDTSQLASTLPARFPEAFEVTIYDDFAMLVAPYAEGKNGRGRFTYRAGTITGPEEASGVQDCKKKAVLGKVDFSLVPRIARQAPGLLGKPDAKVVLVQLGGGVFCDSPKWIVHIKDGGFVEFKLDGKVGKVQKL
jgi:HEAT repeat protein